MRDGSGETPARTTRLESGLTLVTLDHVGPRDAAIVFSVRAGSRDETAATNGISHLLEHMTFRGCDAYPTARALNLAVEELGGHLDAVTSAETTSYELSLPDEHLAEGLVRFARIVGSPTLVGLELEKRVLREEILEDLDDDERNVDVDDLARRTMFGDHPLGLSIAGTLESVEAIDEAALRAYRRRHYVTANASLALVGPRASKLAEVAARAFEGLRVGERPGREPAPAPGSHASATRWGYVEDVGSQSAVRLSYPAVSETHPDRVVVELLVRLLDDGMASRLPARLRDELGLVYDGFASLETFEDAGVLDLGASCSHDAVERVVRELAALAANLEGTLEPEEVARAKRRAVYDVERLADDSLSLATRYADAALRGASESLTERVASIEAVRQDDLRRVAAAVFDPRRAHLCVVGALGSRGEDRLARMLKS